MPFEIVRNDITNVKADAIVNAANPRAVVGYGVDSGIHMKAGDGLIAARKKIGDIAFGDAAVTPAFGLDARIVIHTASPVWQEGCDNESILASCYRRSLELAVSEKCKSIAFPLLSAGNNGFPEDLALKIAISEIGAFLMHNDMDITLVVFDDSVYKLSEKLFSSVKSYIDERYIEEKLLLEYDVTDGDSEKVSRRRRRIRERRGGIFDEIRMMSSSAGVGSAKNADRSIDDLVNEVEESFSESLIRLIDQKGMKDPEVYKRANIDRKLFSKIKNNKDYRPSKSTALAFAIALKLNLDETRDLIGRAGYAMTRSSKADIIIEYFIENKEYDIMEINSVLFGFGQPCIGGV